ncbi:MAG: SMP-30/gluconolactonase/LRE family protein [Candidatus Omnitrophica bacterium]|nr:SMP-30/gluconolactonase/LRE family protein [Candidatus Omnitrophota bacterium]
MKFLLLMAVFILSTRIARAEFKVIDPAEFNKIADPGSSIETIGTGFLFTEGPVWIKSENRLLFSDIDQEKIFSWSKEKGVSVYREESNGANGNFLDKQGRLITAEHQSRQLTYADPDGTVNVLVGTYEGKRFNSPNDLTVSSDGSIWFTDPDYGLRGRKKELSGNFVFKLDTAGTLAVAITELSKPNGLCFSPDEQYLYVADSDGKNHNIHRYAIKNGLLSPGEVFCVIDNKIPDGIRCDNKGRLYVAAGDGIQIFSPAGKLIGKILTDSWPTNLCFGGEDGQTLFITARQSVYAIHLKVKGNQ